MVYRERVPVLPVQHQFWCNKMFLWPAGLHGSMFEFEHKQHHVLRHYGKPLSIAHLLARWIWLLPQMSPPSPPPPLVTKVAWVQIPPLPPCSHSEANKYDSNSKRYNNGLSTMEDNGLLYPAYVNIAAYIISTNNQSYHSVYPTQYIKINSGNARKVK